MITANEPEKNDQRPPDGLDPDRVDEPCRVVDVTTADGRTVPVALRTVGPLTERDRAALVDIVQAVVARAERTNPHAGVIQELAASSFQARRVVRDASEPELADRQQRATRAAMDVMRAAQAVEAGLRAEVERWRDAWQRGDRAWAEDRAALDAERLAHAGTQGERDAARAELALAAAEAEDARNGGMEIVLELAEARAELAGLRERAVILPNDWQSQLDGVIEPGDLVGQPDVVALIESWRPAESAPSGWPCKCGTDETDMVHTAERCYSAVEPVPQALVEAAAAAQESARLADAIGTEPARTEGICPEHGEHYSMCHGPYGCTPEFGTPNSPERKAKVAEAFKDKPQGEWWK
jgi:hypothetical protein